MTKKITPDPPPCRASSLDEKCAYVRNVIHGALDQIASEAPPLPKLLDTLVTTAFKPGSTDSGHKSSLFAVQPGVSAKLALSHVSDLLKYAELNADEICPRLCGVERDLFMGLIHSLEMSRAVVESLLEGIEPQPQQ